MRQRTHWLAASSFLPLFREAIECAERTVTERLDARGELELPEDTITTNFIQDLRTGLGSLSGNLRDLSDSRPLQPAVSGFDFTIADMRDARRDVLGADLAFIFRAMWPNELITKRGILVQAKRLGAISERTRNLIDAKLRRRVGVSLERWERRFGALPFRPPRYPMRVPWPYWPVWSPEIEADDVLGEFSIDSDQLEDLLNVVSSYYMFYDYPVPHMTLPCVQSLTVKNMLQGTGRTGLNRTSVLRQSLSLADLLTDELVACHIGEWNYSFAQLEVVADQNRVGSIETPAGEFNVNAYNVSFVVIIDVTVTRLPHDREDKKQV